MINKVVISLCLMALLCFSDCKNDWPEEPFFPIKFELKLLNESGQKSTSFTQGTDITFSFEMTNATIQYECIRFSEFCSFSVSPTTEYFLVYQKTQDNQWNQVGKPCGILLCPALDFFCLESDSTRKFQCSWLEAPQSPLPTGKFKTGFQFEFEMLEGEYDGLKSLETFLVEFEIN